MTSESVTINQVFDEPSGLMVPFRLAGAPDYDPDLWNNRLNKKVLVEAFCADPLLQKAISAQFGGNEEVLGLFQRWAYNSKNRTLMERAALITFCGLVGSAKRGANIEYLDDLYELEPEELPVLLKKIAGLDKLRGWSGILT